jgi:hypothetical protein
MGRPRKERTTHIRVRVNLLNGLRNEFPNISTDNDRIASVYDYYTKVQKGINTVGGFIYGKRAWKKAVKK